MRRQLLLFVVVGLALGLNAVPVAAQGVTGTLFGVVADSSAGVLPGATATITSAEALPGGPMVAITGAQGEYRFTELPPGTYGLKIELPGFSVYEEPDLRVAAGGTTERNISLPLASVAETITVTGESPVVDTRRSGIAATRTTEEVEQLPIERRATTDYAKNLPGATASSYNATNGISIMGSNTSGVTMTQDGAQYNNVKSGGGYPIQDMDAVAEVNVTLLGASAEYQQAAGGVMNVIMKSGTNQFRGDARWYQLSKGTMAKPVFLPCNCPEGETAQKWFGNLDYSAPRGWPHCEGPSLAIRRGHQDPMVVSVARPGIAAPRPVGPRHLAAVRLADVVEVDLEGQRQCDLHPEQPLRVVGVPHTVSECHAGDRSGPLVSGGHSRGRVGGELDGQLQHRPDRSLQRLPDARLAHGYGAQPHPK